MPSSGIKRSLGKFIGQGASHIKEVAGFIKFRVLRVRA